MRARTILATAVAFGFAATRSWGVWPEEAVLAPPDGAAYDLFGTSVAVSGDLALVGARSHGHEVSEAGAVYVFRREAEAWVLETELTADEPTRNANFGEAVALDGSVALVGEGQRSFAYVLVRNAGVWTQEARLAPETPSSGFGNAVALRGDLAIVGARYDSHAGTWSGSAHVFRRVSGAWMREARLVAPDARADDEFGAAVAIGDGVAVVGARGADEAGDRAGAVYVFRESGGVWNFEEKLLPPDAGPSTRDAFGFSVSLSGNAIAVGAPFADVAASDGGAAYVYRYGAEWTLESRLVAFDAQGTDELGASVAIDGDVVAAGSPGSDDALGDSGSAHVFRRDGGGWRQEAKLVASDETQLARYGRSIALSGDAIAVGAPSLTVQFQSRGQAYVNRMADCPPSILSNISTRGFVGTGSEVMIPGFIVAGTGTKRVLVSGIGPNLSEFGIQSPLADPSLFLLRGQNVLSSNDDWRDGPDAAAIEASGFAPVDDRESAILAELAPGEYTAILNGADGGTGVGLVQVFDLGGTATLTNISTRLPVGSDQRAMIAGFAVGGATLKRVLVRGLGPTLAGAPFNVPGAMADPELTIFEGQTPLAANFDWMDAANAAEVAASGFAPPIAAEPAILITLEPGQYTAVLTGANGTEGTALVEVYELP